MKSPKPPDAVRLASAVAAEAPADDAPVAGGAASTWLSRHTEALVFTALLVYFALRVAFLALSISPDVPPDEIAHMGLCGVYARTFGLPTDGPETHAIGLVSHRPYLYHWLMGRLLHANASSLSDLVFLRFINGLLGCALIFVGWRWIRLVSTSVVVRLLFVVMVTNILMLTAMSAAVSYDPLTNLLAAAAVYALTRFFADRSPWALLCLVASILAGALTKTAFLPLAPLLLGVLLVRERRRLGELAALLWAAVRSPAGAAAGLGSAALLALNLGLYGTNLARFGSLQPSAAQVLEPAERQQYPNEALNSIVSRYLSGKIDLQQALAEARAIELEAVRRDALQLLESLAQQRARREAFVPLSRLAYGREWAFRMGLTMFGYNGHQGVWPSTVGLYLYHTIGLWALASMLALLAWRRAPARDFVWLAIPVAYSLVLMLMVNYPGYVRTQSVGWAVQGRYLFPVLLPLWGMVAKYALAALPGRLGPWAALLIALWFLRGDVFWFTQYAPPELFFNTPP